ncbi:uncharacterized protein TRIADDRAFT_53503 [Trichoplax adhaerens]|uniref:Axonemal dynein light chain domain-containing protein 1 n=1 Tax=Trichoplax adhaerens TaxID=10228 RepID=B3RPE2_TRIAD|nr:hypothetical protein TRIADDRAFT_53503 [Trichoplax adhaerens]EDV27619.1 hypothetical protein TRIADDRAFT_53503 [Trichoplax adhaerens]|eukprot:XP_002109453.1 hypothetical protein TRIADDRAFT_53503 [Trichoplax adhaerens]
MASTVQNNREELQTSRTPSPKVTTLPYINPANESIITQRNEDHSGRMSSSNIANDHIPQEVLANLIRLSTPPPNKDHVGISAKKKSKKLPSPRTPSNAWNFASTREKFKHLAEKPTCTCGAGSGLTFLYDKSNSPVKDTEVSIDDNERAEKSQELARTVLKNPNNETKLSVSREKIITSLADTEAKDSNDEEKNTTVAKTTHKIPDTLIPLEYHIIKAPAVAGLEFQDERPTSRQEVLQLKHTMELMLKKAGISDLDTSKSTGPTQIHNLLDVIEKEQTIYNICFHEVIRQVSVECVERGELLADIRQRYSGLFNRIPRQIMRRLIAELSRFKTSIGDLSKELAEVRNHDFRMSSEAKQAKAKLVSAMEESDKNVSLLTEYHQLYELQRRRLEVQVAQLSEEREIWSNCAYSLSLKVTESHQLNTARRLHLSEKAWVKFATHFTVLTSDRDSIELSQLQHKAHMWQEKIDRFVRSVNKKENNLCDQLNKTNSGIRRWLKEFDKCLYPEAGAQNATLPSNSFLQKFLNDVNLWEGIINAEIEKFTGDSILTAQEEIKHATKLVEAWTDLTIKLSGRHSTSTQSCIIEMKNINQEIGIFNARFIIRVAGENGVAKALIDMVNNMETWANRIYVHFNTDPLTETDWFRLYNSITDWEDKIKYIHEIIGTVRTEFDSEAMTPEKCQQAIQNLFLTLQNWTNSITHAVENDDTKIINQVTSVHMDMISWMVQLLLQVTPDMDDSPYMQHFRENGKKYKTADDVKAAAVSIIERLRSFTKDIISNSNDIVMETRQAKLDLHDETADDDYKDLQRMKRECDEWIEAAGLLVGEMLQIQGDSLKRLFSDKTTWAATPEELKIRPIEAVSSNQLATSKEGTEEQEDKTAQTDQPQLEKQDEGLKDSALSQEEVDTPPEEVQGENMEQNQEEKPPKIPESAETNREEEEKSQEAVKEDDTVNEVNNDVTDSIDSTNKIDEKPVEETQDQIEEDDTVKETKPQGEEIVVVADDENIRTRNLTALEQSIRRTGTPGQHSAISLPSSDTIEASNNLKALQPLNQHLLETELRAQEAEDRAIKAEFSLKEALNKIITLERQLQEQEQKQKHEPKSDSNKVGMSHRKVGASNTKSRSNPQKAI